MSALSQYLHFSLALLAILDPFMAIPVFLSMQAGRAGHERRRTAGLVALIVFAVLSAAALGGDALLRILGTSIASFRVAGGLVLLLMALAMLQARIGTSSPSPVERDDVRGDLSGAVPLAIPLLAGPGAISTVMIASQGSQWTHVSAIIACIAAVCLIVWLMLRLAAAIERLLGATGMNIANRLVGLLLAAIAVEAMAHGLRDLFPALAG